VVVLLCWCWCVLVRIEICCKPALEVYISFDGGFGVGDGGVVVGEGECGCVRVGDIGVGA